MKFVYLPATGVLDSTERQVKRPILPLELTAKDGGTFEAHALVDSGADVTTLNIQYANLLGIKLGKKGELIGIGRGKVETQEGRFVFKIAHTSFQLKVPALFVDSENVDILLGQEAFFDMFKVKFEKHNDIFEIVPIQENK